MAKKKTYRTRARARKRFYKNKKLYSHAGTKRARFVKIVRVMILNNMQGAGDGYQWFNFGSQTTIQAHNLNVWTDILQPDADFTNTSAQYPLFKPYAVSITAIPSHVNTNSNDGRRDCTALISVNCPRQQVDYNMRKMILDPFQSTKMYFKIGSYTDWCYCNPTNQQSQIDNNYLANINLDGNSGVQPFQLCPVWTVRICSYVKFKSKRRPTTRKKMESMLLLEFPRLSVTRNRSFGCS